VLFRSLIPNFANLVNPLTELMKLNPNSKSLSLSNDEKSAFVDVKTALANVNPLAYSCSSVTHYQLVTDSSSYAVGAALHQMLNSEPVPIGFFSKKLSEAQRKFSTFDRELLACYLAVIHFKPQIEGKYVTIFTDHKPLSLAFHKQTPLKTDKQQRYMSLITEFIADIKYVKGSQNVVADCLSRPVNSVTLDPCDLNSISMQQLQDEELVMYKDKLKPFTIADQTVVWCDVSLPVPRPFVPK